MENKTKARDLLFEWYWLAPVFIILGLIISQVMGCLNEDNERMWLAFVAAGLGWTYFFQKQKLEEDKLFLELFENYNKRFSELSKGLNSLDDTLDCSENLTPVVHEYFDLCIEQYQLYERGRIPKDIWLYWVVGMNHLLKKPPIRQYWKTMEKNGLSIKLTIDYIESLASQSKPLE